jgi:hypothetical protein
MAGIGSAAVALMASCVCNRKKSLGPLHLVHVPRYILYIYIYWNCSIKLQNKELKHGEVVGNDTCGVSLCLKSHLLQKAPASRSSESLDRHSNLDILFEKWKRHELSIRFDSSDFPLPQRIWQKHCPGSCYFSTILPLLSLATTGGSSANRGVWTWSGFKPSYRCAFGLLKTLLLRLEFKSI